MLIFTLQTFTNNKMFIKRPLTELELNQKHPKKHFKTAQDPSGGEGACESGLYKWYHGNHKNYASMLFS